MQNELYWRLGAFLAGLVIFSIWESLTPKRPRQISRLIRWPRNLGINFSSVILINLINSVLTRFFVPIAAAGAAIWAANHNFGLMNALSLPLWLSLPLTIILLDLVIYAQHVLFHASPTLWRLHMIHHIDQELDATSGIRFHPVEILLSLILKMGVVLILGAPFLGVVIFEIILNLSAMFNHGNIRLSQNTDRFLRAFIVTPDMHRVHHSVIPKETHSNFGFNLSLWDKIFGTYRAQPKEGHQDMKLGLPGFESVPKTGLGFMLLRPFTRTKSSPTNKNPKTPKA